MKVSRKEYEVLAVEFAKRYANNWDYFILSTGAYMAGYQKCKEDLLNKATLSDNLIGELTIFEQGENLIEDNIEDGLHQLSNKTFEHWVNVNNEVKND